MWRFMILASMAPFIIGGIFANLLGVRVLAASSDISVTVKDLMEKLLRVMDRGDIELRFTKKSPWVNNDERGIQLPPRYADSKKAGHAARAAIQLGMYLLHEKHPAPVAWRRKVVKTGYILPIFVMLVVLFSFVVGKLPGVVFLTAIATSLGICTVMLWLSMAVEKEAAHLMVSRIEKLRILPRLRDEESLTGAIRALPWVSLIPGALIKFVIRD